jgi:hypothetical protein
LGRNKKHLRSGVFISHISQEKPVALVLQNYLKLAFGDAFRVFVSSDAKSIGGGTKWYTHIIENLRVSDVVLVLVSHESKGREWINFEAGFGEGSESLVIPIAIHHISLGQLSWPLAGIQARHIGDIGSILQDVGDRIGATPGTVDANVYSAELEGAEAQLIYRSIKVEPVVQDINLTFDITNVGNIDVELLMLEVYVPQDLILGANQRPLPGPTDGVDVTGAIRNDVPYKRCVCLSARGVYGNIKPLLCPIITQSMGTVRPAFSIPIRRGSHPILDQLSIFYQVHATGYRTEEEERKKADIPSWT